MPRRRRTKRSHAEANGEDADGAGQNETAKAAPGRSGSDRGSGSGDGGASDGGIRSPKRAKRTEEDGGAGDGESKGASGSKGRNRSKEAKSERRRKRTALRRMHDIFEEDHAQDPSDDDDGGDDDGGDDDRDGDGSGDGATPGSGSDDEMFGFDQDDGFDADGEKLPGRSFAAAFAHVARKTADKPVVNTNRELEERLDEEKTVRMQDREHRMQRAIYISRGRNAHPRVAAASERALKKIATRGIVKLFNAIKEHQTIAATEVKGSRYRKRKQQVAEMSKASFLDLLKAPAPKGKSKKKKKKKKADDAAGAAAAANEPGWGVLRDDFMLGAKLRDWDKGGDGDGQADATAVTAAALEFSDSG